MPDAFTKYYEDESMFHGFIPRIMGTQFNVLIISEDRVKCEVLWTKINNKLKSLDKMLNRFDLDSEVSYLNALQPSNFVSVSSELNIILDECRYYYTKTLHLFDITLKDFSKIKCENGNILFASSDLILDFGGIAKGYALKLIKAMLEAEDIENVFVNFGNSSILGMGHHPYGDCWKVSFENPYDNQRKKNFELRNETLSTSGNTPIYEGHVLNPLTGIYDFSQDSSLVISSDPLLAEILSTVMLIADEKQKVLILDNFKDIETTLYKL